jgi:polar amino acid transport system substrate-binding protein
MKWMADDLFQRRRNSFFIFILLAGYFGIMKPNRLPAADAVQTRKAGEMRFGADLEGGAPYFIPNPDKPNAPDGFEAEILASIGSELQLKPVFHQGQWDQLPRVLSKGDVDFICNGFELKPVYVEKYRPSRPYFRYRLALMLPEASPVQSWNDLLQKASQGKKLRVGVLVNSSADEFATKNSGEKLEIIRFDGATDAMLATRNGQVDATLQDEPAASWYIRQKEFTGRLKLTPDRVGPGWYVIYFNKENKLLAEAVDRAIGKLIDSGELRLILEKYNLWHEEQSMLADPQQWENAINQTMSLAKQTSEFRIRRYLPFLIKAAAMTVFLSLSSMPLAIAIGLSVAIGRLYGPRFLRPLLVMYVEFLRGTPLMLQLFFIFYIIPELFGFGLPAILASILGLAINYSAYESEIYRAGLQAIPDGQMEAALALGMKRSQAIRRIIIPQATRIVIPPVTNDFIALFKDTSVCSVITVVELTKQYSILANSTLKVLEFALITSILYLAMSWPLSRFASWYERKLEADENHM